MVETFAFQAEINQLLSLIINTFYSNKDIFLRELISNSSDAIDKDKFNSIDNDNKQKDYSIYIRPDKEEKTLIIQDNGVGMTKSDMISCLGTIANSGTKQFMENISSGNADLSMIGQFGVGFYSAYLVADNVQVYSKHKDSSVVHLWESKAGGSFTISEVTDSDLSDGTRIVLYIKEDCQHYLDESKCKEIINTHSQYILYPIHLWTTRTESKEVPIDDTTQEVDNEEGKIEEVDNEEDKPKTKTIQEEIQEYVQVNTQLPIWVKKSEDVTHEEYSTFYKSLTNDWDEPLTNIHFVAEGQIEFKSLLYIPKRAPFDMFKQNTKKNNIKLFVRRVFIMDKCEDLIPDWLNFVSGVIDSEDLPLNVSREMLQQNKIIKVIQKNIVKKCIEMIQKLADDEDKSKFNTFYEAFHQSLKLGIHEDSNNRSKLVKLLRFQTLNHTNPISLDDYVTNMKDNQTDIYFITGESRKAVEHSPFVNGIKNMGFDVLFLTDPIDEYMVQQIKDYDDKKLVHISKENVSFNNTDESIIKEFDEHVCKKIKEVLSSKIEKVIVSNRLSTDPCCLVTGEYGWSANMERIMKAQTLQNNNSMFMNGGKKTMEINPKHNIVLKLQENIKNNVSPELVNDSIHLLYDTACLASGFVQDDPSSFTNRIYNILGVSMGIEEGCDEESCCEKESCCETANTELDESPMESLD